jgi:hypothetical protein
VHLPGHFRRHPAAGVRQAPRRALFLTLFFTFRGG